MVEVARHPEVQQRIQQEIKTVVSDDEQYLLPSHLSQLTYLECVIKEGMRLWPVAALGSIRLASKDIPYNDYIIPKGSYLMIPFYPLFRTADIQVSSEVESNVHLHLLLHRNACCPVLGSRELSSRSLGGRCPRGGEAAAEGHLLPLRAGQEKLRRPESGQARAQAGAGIHAAVLPIRAAVRGLQGLLPHHEASQRHLQSVQTLIISSFPPKDCN